MTKKEVNDLIKEIRRTLLNDYFHNVKEIAVPGRHTKGHKMIGFILGSMMIDYLAGFYAGVTVSTVHTDSGKRYKDFVSMYMSSYNPDDLWKFVRSRLVHNYSVGGDYGFTHMSRRRSFTKSST